HHLIRSWGIRHEKRFDVDEVLYPHCVKKLLVGYLQGPQSEEMVDDHEYFVGDGSRRFLLADAHLETPKGTAQEGRRFLGTPGTLHPDSAEVAIPLARFAMVPFARTLVIPGTDPSP